MGQCRHKGPSLTGDETPHLTRPKCKGGKTRRLGLGLGRLGLVKIDLTTQLKNPRGK